MARAGINVVVVTASEERSRWGVCMRQGARKVLSKGAPLQDVLSTVRRLHQGLPVVTSDELTPRERQVLVELIYGHTVRTIARVSVVSEATVRTQVKSILAKLEVSSQLAAVGMAPHAGWHQQA